MDRVKIVGANLRLARLFHGLTLDDVAAHVAKTRQFVHKVETEQIDPSPLVVDQIAELTQVLPEFFVSSMPSPITEEQCHFRKHFTTRAPVKHVALAKGEMFRRIVASLEEHIDLPNVRIPQAEVSSLVEIELAAEKCRRVWELGLGPIHNMTRVAEHVGAVVTTFRGVSREVDAYSISSARPLVVVNVDEASSCRARFDVAHEIGHLVMHVGQLTGDRRSESEANRFAGALLLPRSSFVKEFPRLRGNHLNWSGLSEMKLRWKVSKSALLFRARQLGLVSEDQYKTGVIRLARGGEARQETEDMLIPTEAPELFENAVDLVCAHHRWTIETFSRQSLIKAAIVEEFLRPRSPMPTSTVDNVISVDFRRSTSATLARKRV